MDAGAQLLIRALGRGSAVRLAVHGDCMEPVLRDGDWARIEPLAAPVRSGDVVLARTDGEEFVCHRVLGRTRGGVLAAGDRGGEVLEHPLAEVFGRVVTVERDGETRPLRRRWVDGARARTRLWARALLKLSPARIRGRLRRRRPARATLADDDR